MVSSIDYQMVNALDPVTRHFWGGIWKADKRMSGIGLARKMVDAYDALHGAQYLRNTYPEVFFKSEQADGEFSELSTFADYEKTHKMSTVDNFGRHNPLWIRL